jgi:glycosyltransferase involved in cell wall biosynthesis
LVRLIYPFFKLILWEHTTPTKSPSTTTWIYALSTSIFYQISNKIVTVSNAVQDDIRKCTIGLSNKMTTIYSPIIPPHYTTKKLNKSNSRVKPLIIFVGRLEREKNPEFLVRAFALFLSRMDADLLFVGNGVLRSSLEDLCVELKIKNKVRFLGYVTRPYEIMINADLLILSSDFEGLPTVVVEALYCGLPIVSTDCFGGVRELLLDGKYGTLVPVNDTVAFANAMEFELKNKRSLAIQKLAAQRFLPSIVFEKFVLLIK